MAHPARGCEPFFLLLAAGTLACVSSPAFADRAERGELRIGTSASRPDTLVLHWAGKIAAPMAREIESAFEQRKGQVRRVVLTLASGGGSVQEGERVIAVLRRIKQTHPLQTVVGHGQMCGSMCVFVYVQGERRTAALSSTWLFHETARTDPTGKHTISLNRQLWERLIDDYWVPAGVSSEWIAKIKPLTIRSDYWQTGADLVNEDSGIVHEALGNQRPRVVADGKGPGPRAEILPESRRSSPEMDSALRRPRSAERRESPAPERIAEPRGERVEPAGGGTPAPQQPVEPRAKGETAEKECKVYVPSFGMTMTLPCSAAGAVK
jgi:hypothetical protein